ncbi:hypothetical protein [uncultured Algoriphagus sp.]|uniref:hypothetical protein n=1 Tax=uncultured Algoriphagus sp. TaxID=417365 RepID=UPI0030EE7BE8|tara:strand:+ start:1241 stop:1528 length:288 start_codon:yes stop_codon:yes gene_type:complete
MVFKDKKEQYNEASLELKDVVNDSDWGLTQDEYDSAIEYYNECDNTFNLNQFALYPNSIEIIEECRLPHVMKPLTPIIELKYRFSEIGEYLKIKI